MELERYQIAASKISGLDDDISKTKEELIYTAKTILNMYNEPETSFYNDLHCDYKRNKYTTPEQVRTLAKKHISQLKAFIKKYS
jgi:hypothetical protein